MRYIGELVTIIGGGTPSKKKENYWNGDIPWASVKDLKSDYLSTTQDRISKEGLENSASNIIRKNSILIGTRMAPGKTAINKIDVAINQDLKGIYCKEPLYYKYLFYYLKSKVGYFTENSSGATVKGIKLEHIKNLQIPLPPLPEQKRIAAILDEADRLRQKDKQLIEKYNQLSQSVFLDMFGDTFLNPMGWKVQKIHEIAASKKHSIKAGPFGSSLKKEYYTKSGYKIYGQEQVIKDDLSYGDYYVSEEKYKQLESCKIQAGDVLISLVGTYGKISIIPDQFEPGIINPRLMKISLNEEIITPNFFKTLLQTKGVMVQISNQSRGGTMDIVNVGIIKEINVPVPPLKNQLEYLKITTEIEKQKAQAQQSLAKSEDLFNSLLQRAFKGEL